MKPLLILAGGFGTRLRSVLPHTPKPLAPIFDKTFLDYFLKNCVDQGASDITLLLHHKAELMKHAVAEMKKTDLFSNVKIKTITEDNPLGTGGSIKHALQKLKLNESFLVMNADTWIGTGLKEISKLKPNVVGAVYLQDVSRYGLLCIDDGIVKSIDEKPSSIRSGWINAGIYHFEPHLFEQLKLPDIFSLEQIVLPYLVKTHKLSALRLATEFVDIGIPEDYAKFKNLVMKGEIKF